MRKVIRKPENIFSDKEEIKEIYTAFVNRRLWSGPSFEFHRWTIKYLERNKYNYTILLRKECYLKYLYATLSTWGVHGMRPSNKMCSFDEFSNKLRSIESELNKLKEVTLESIEANHYENLKSIFKMLDIREESKHKLVSVSKTLHHLIPNIVPPIDRRYTLNFFFEREIAKNTSKIYHPSGGAQIKQFIKIIKLCSNFYKKKRQIINEIKSTNIGSQYISGMETSITKIIDNIIVSFVLKKTEN